jgi:DNA polymerase family A
MDPIEDTSSPAIYLLSAVTDKLPDIICSDLASVIVDDAAKLYMKLCPSDREVFRDLVDEGLVEDVTVLFRTFIPWFPLNEIRVKCPAVIGMDGNLPSIYIVDVDQLRQVYEFIIEHMIKDETRIGTSPSRKVSGWNGEQLDVQASIAMTYFCDRGFQCDVDEVNQEIQKRELRMEEIRNSRDIYKWKGEYNVHTHLLHAATSLGIPIIDHQLTDALSTFRRVRDKIDKDGPFKWILEWLEFADLDYDLKCLRGLRASIVNGKVSPQWAISQSGGGRISVKNPSYQCFPRKPGVRELIKAPLGCSFIIADFKCIELVTLAASATHRGIASRMSQLLGQGVDLHSHTAQQLLAKKMNTTTDTKTIRQSAKLFNMAIAYGMGATTLREKLAAEVGIVLKPRDVRLLKDQYKKSLYPEIDLMHRLQVPLTKRLSVIYGLPEPEVTSIAFRHRVNVIADESAINSWVSAHGGDLSRFSPIKLKSIWAFFRTLSKRSPLEESKKLNKPTDIELHPAFWEHSDTLSSRCKRVFGGPERVSVEASSLAADGAKRCLWACLRNGWRVVLFVHDEFVIEVPTSIANDIAHTIKKTLESEMSSVIHNKVPVTVDVGVREHWTKL